MDSVQFRTVAPSDLAPTSKRPVHPTEFNHDTHAPEDLAHCRRSKSHADSASGCRATELPAALISIGEASHTADLVTAAVAAAIAAAGAGCDGRLLLSLPVLACLVAVGIAVPGAELVEGGAVIGGEGDALPALALPLGPPALAARGSASLE